MASTSERADLGAECTHQSHLKIYEDQEVPEKYLNTPAHAMATLPAVLEIRKSKTHGLGVFSRTTIPKGARFGPLKAWLQQNDQENEIDLVWNVLRNETFTQFINGGNGSSCSNWMVYVNCADHKKERNLQAYQFQGETYFCTHEEILPNQELLVWYGEQYMEDLISSTAEDTETEKEANLCKRCGKLFTSSHSLEVHMKHACPRPAVSKPSVICSLCNNDAVTPEAATTHLQTHMTAGDKNCPLCDRMFSCTRHVRRHLRVHTGEKRYRCAHCEKSFFYSGDLTRHRRIHTDQRPFKCTFCDRRFNHTGDLKRHLRYHTGERPFQCTLCFRAFTHSSDLNNHVKTHTVKTYRCTHCNKAFNNDTDLSRHIFCAHTGEKLFKCTYCDKSFALENLLLKHQRTHTAVKRLQCTYCDKTFSRRSHLDTHIRTHTGEKPFQCRQCEKWFTSAGYLSKHVRAHALKIFQCTYCNKAFSTVDSLNVHIRSHTGEKPLLCPHSNCDKAYSRDRYLTRHLRDAHI